MEKSVCRNCGRKIMKSKFQGDARDARAGARRERWQDFRDEQWYICNPVKWNRISFADIPDSEIHIPLDELAILHEIAVGRITP